MYILSQNKERLVKVSSLFIEKNGDNWEIDNEGDWLGTYKTKEKAKKVLKEIFEDLDWGHATFEMPLDEEIEKREIEERYGVWR